MSHPQWQQSCDEKAQILGELSRETVPALWNMLKAWKSNTSQFELSLEYVDRIDSSGMVMLIHLIENAKNQNCHIMLSFVPEQLTTLFQLSNVEALVAEHVKNKQG
ncbi:STAS domain-containing protein [Vibrio sonorensis]|uniref:STAS domain-containing protein n=1 Tax=Vibrio sonorensis TaxID=1004316 RepID=UPI0008D9D9E3|nr:lipid asymmetry maintenance protein MlaB [Vibrio sonorensis]